MANRARAPWPRPSPPSASAAVAHPRFRAAARRGPSRGVVSVTSQSRRSSRRSSPTSAPPGWATGHTASSRIGLRAYGLDDARRPARRGLGRGPRGRRARALRRAPRLAARARRAGRGRPRPRLRRGRLRRRPRRPRGAAGRRRRGAARPAPRPRAPPAARLAPRAARPAAAARGRGGRRRLAGRDARPPRRPGRRPARGPPRRAARRAPPADHARPPARAPAPPGRRRVRLRRPLQPPHRPPALLQRRVAARAAGRPRLPGPRGRERRRDAVRKRPLVVRVLLDTTYLARGHTGTGTYLRMLVPALRGLGVDVHEAANPRRGAPGEGSVRNALADRWWAEVELPRLARSLRADLIHHPLPARSPGVRTVVTVHDLAFEVHPELFARRFATWARIAHGRAARTADAVVAVSHTTANEAMTRWGLARERVVVAPHGPGQPLGGVTRRQPAHVLYVGDA